MSVGEAAFQNWGDLKQICQIISWVLTGSSIIINYYVYIITLWYKAAQRITCTCGLLHSQRVRDSKVAKTISIHGNTSGQCLFRMRLVKEQQSMSGFNNGMADLTDLVNTASWLPQCSLATFSILTSYDFYCFWSFLYWLLRSRHKVKKNELVHKWKMEN